MRRTLPRPGPRPPSTGTAPRTSRPRAGFPAGRRRRPSPRPSPSSSPWPSPLPSLDGRSTEAMLALALAVALQSDCNGRRHHATGGGSGMRARYPDQDGYVERDGVKVFYEVFGDGAPTILLMPTWSIIHSRHWKMQVPYLARHYRVVTFDGRGNGRSDRPVGPEAYEETEYAADALAVMDQTDTDQAVIVSLSMGAQRSLILAAEHPERAIGAVFIAPAVPLAPRPPERAIVERFEEVLDTDQGWAKYNRHYWLRDHRGFLEFFFSNAFSERHSTKPIEDCVEWGLETTPE